MKTTRRKFTGGLIAAGAIAALPALAITNKFGQKHLWYSGDGIKFRQGNGPWIDITNEVGGFINRLDEGDLIIVKYAGDDRTYRARVGSVFVNSDGIETFVRTRLDK